MHAAGSPCHGRRQRCGPGQEALQPGAALISVAFQLNYDDNIGPTDSGHRWVPNVQPVIPFALNADWNVISRTIVPLVSQADILPFSGTQTGVGDVVQSFFFSPRHPRPVARSGA